MRSCIMYSAGVDSYILREFLTQEKKEFDCLYFNYHGRYSDVEIETLRSQGLDFRLNIVDNMDFSMIEKPNAFIPNRNILMSVMANSLGYDNIWIGGSLSDRVNDNNEKVFDELSAFLTKMSGRYVKISSPFWECYKTDMVHWFIKHSKSPTARRDLLTKTFSCYNPIESRTRYIFEESSKVETYTTKECHSCPACFRKNVILFVGGTFIDFDDEKIIDKYLEEFELGIIPTTRSESTLRYIQEWKYKHGC